MHPTTAEVRPTTSKPAAGFSRRVEKATSKDAELWKLRDAQPPDFPDNEETFSANIRTKFRTERTLREYHHLLSAYEKTRMAGEIFWGNFITSFRRHTIRSWTKGLKINWVDLLTCRGVHVSNDKTRPVIQNVIDIIYADRHVKEGPNKQVVDPPMGFEHEEAKEQETERRNDYSEETDECRNQEQKTLTQRFHEGYDQY